MVYLNIGSNLGEADQNIGKALEAIATRFGVPLSVSKPYYSLPWGYTSGNSYTNIGVAFDISVEDPEELLRKLLEIQFEICPKSHRDDSGGYIDRVIDIDLIAIDNLVIERPTLILPHPRMHLRDFVLEPMNEIAPHWLHPLFHQTCSQMLDKLQETMCPQNTNDSEDQLDKLEDQGGDNGLNDVNENSNEAS